MKLPRLFALFPYVAFVLLAFKTLNGQEPAYQGTNLSVWMDKMERARTEQRAAEASNALHRIGTNAVPFLLQIVRTNRPPTDGSMRVSRFHSAAGKDKLSLEVSLVCRILGHQAESVFSELTNRLSSADKDEAHHALDILLNSGGAALWPLIEFYSSECYSPAGPMVVPAVTYEATITPAETILALIQIYGRGNAKMRAIAKELLETAFSRDLEKEDFGLLLPALRSNFQNRDFFIRTQILVYLRRCGPSAGVIVLDVKKLLGDSDPMVRSKATNALAAIQPQK